MHIGLLSDLQGQTTCAGFRTVICKGDIVCLDQCWTEVVRSMKDELSSILRANLVLMNHGAFHNDDVN